MATKKCKTSSDALDTSSGVIQGARSDTGSGRMVVDSLTLTGSEADTASRQRLAACGYKIPSDAPLQIIHCDKGRGILANGFSQVFADVDGQKCRILGESCNNLPPGHPVSTPAPVALLLTS
jgi:hypothetical protein